MSTTISRRVEGAGLSRQDFQIPGSTDSAGESSLLRYLSLTLAIFELGYERDRSSQLKTDSELRM